MSLARLAALSLAHGSTLLGPPGHRPVVLVLELVLRLFAATVLAGAAVGLLFCSKVDHSRNVVFLSRERGFTRAGQAGLPVVAFRFAPVLQIASGHLAAGNVANVRAPPKHKAFAAPLKVTGCTPTGPHGPPRVA